MHKRKVLIIDDTDSLLDFCQQFLADNYEYYHITSGKSLEKQINITDYDVIILDQNFSTLPKEQLLGPIEDAEHEGLRILKAIKDLNTKIPVIVITRYADYDTMARALRMGAYDYVETTAAQKDEMFLRMKMERACRKLQEDKHGIIETFRGLGLVGEHPKMMELFNEITNVAKSDLTVLIEGDTGTGKELVAKAIHQLSPRAKKPFVVVDCTKIPESLSESLLFGIQKRVATDVDERTGKFELANSGTIFFDEIGDFPLNLQPKLLRVLEEKKIERIGSSSPLAVDVRIICATNKKLKEGVTSGTFRSDLFYRINAVSIVVPTLAERRSDIHVLISHFITQYGDLLERDPIEITPEALDFLENREWDGNVRQLENMVKNLVEHSDRIITLKDLFQCFEKLTPETKESDKYSSQWSHDLSFLQDKTLSQLEKLAIIYSLQQSDGYIEPAAKALGIGKSKMYERIKLFELKHLVKGYSPKSPV